MGVALTPEIISAKTTELANAALSPEVISSVTSVKFTHPYLLLLIPILIFATYIILKKRNKAFDKREYKSRREKSKRFFLFLSRVVIISIIVIALSSPYLITTQEREGEPKAVILIDNSTSMELFDTSFTTELQDYLSDYLPVSVKVIGEENESGISDGIIRNMDYKNIILVSDGNNYEGKDLRETMMFAASNNASINAISLEAQEVDSSVQIIGPSKVVEGVQNEFIIKLSQTKKAAKSQTKVRITIDDKLLQEVIVTETPYHIKRSFTSGTHVIQAEISGNIKDDYFSENNNFYKTVRVVKKPNIFLLSNKKSPLSTILAKLYAVDKGFRLPNNLDKYLAVVVEDMNIASLNSDTAKRLSKFTSKGNGLIFVGGENSFEYGDYKDSYLETILPVKIAKGKEKPSKDINVVILLDKSASTTTRLGTGVLGVNLEKEIAINIIDQINKDNYVGVIAFNDKAQIISDLIKKEDNFEYLKEGIVKITPMGDTRMEDAFVKGIKMLEDRRGSRNIILISDGKDVRLPNYMSMLREAAADGILTHTVNIGADSDKASMIQIARAGNGVFFNPGEKSTVSIVFDKPKDTWPINVLPKDHFITSNLRLQSFVTGFNQAVPKSTSQLLATTAYGDPFLVTGRIGLGRVAVLLTDGGSFWASNMYFKDPQFISRIVNWGIENPERKESSYVLVSDLSLGDNKEVLIKSQDIPEYKDFIFSKEDKNIFTTKISGDTVGVYDFISTKYAVNYHNELRDIGMNENYYLDVSSANGNLFYPNNLEIMRDRLTKNSIETVTFKKSLVSNLLLLVMVLFLTEVVVRRVYKFISKG